MRNDSVHADTIYRTRENRKYYKDRDIRLSGKPIRRPKKPTAENADELKAQKTLEHQDERERIPVEGKFSNCIEHKSISTRPTRSRLASQ